MSIRKREPQDDTQASDLETWTNVNPFTEAANAPGGVESVGGICGTLMEKSRRQLGVYRSGAQESGGLELLFY